MRKRRIIPTLPVNFFEDTDNKAKYQKMLYSSIIDGVEQTLENGKPSFIMMRVDDGRNLKDVSVLKESFKSNLGVAFDPFSISETSANMTLGLILRPKRLNRLILQHSLDNSNLSLNDLYDYIFKRTILLKTNDISSINDSYYEEVQHIVNVSLLKNIFKVINDSSTFSQVQNISNDYLSKIIRELYSKKRKDYKLSKYSTHYVKMINDFYKDPEEYKIKDPLKIPDGSPIGTDNCSHNPKR